MAQLTQHEFTQAIGLLAEDLGLQRLRDRFVRLNALVTRRRATSVEVLADQLYLLTGGLRRQVPATVAFHTIWSQQVTEKLGEDGEKEVEAMADRINGCLGEHDHVLPEKEAELDEALTHYLDKLTGVIGNERARLDMLLKSVPSVGDKVRAMPANEPVPASGESS